MSHVETAMGQLSQARDQVEANPGKCVRSTWFAILGLSIIAVIVAIAAAAENGGETGSNGAAFAAVWTLFILCAVSVGGTVVLKRFHTPLAVGTFLGVCAMMSQLMFVLFVVFVAEAKDAEGNERSGDRAMAAFCFLLFLLYMVFALVLAKYRTTVISTHETEVAKNDVGGWAPEGGAVNSADAM